ncbi:MAG TPA: DUF1496 domain-containing protein [Gemmatimonadetes bacterium]|nr:hypothetical protein [Gemmatimonadota bacterium]HIF57660.1 DUF1496 domain-containing protein [Gemmatimonadota bacterium]HIL90330.1 DUF1496 domain-containing protein [Gemmatimonadota bacterium]
MILSQAKSQSCWTQARSYSSGSVISIKF